MVSYNLNLKIYTNTEFKKLKISIHVLSSNKDDYILITASKESNNTPVETFQ